MSNKNSRKWNDSTNGKNDEIYVTTNPRTKKNSRVKSSRYISKIYAKRV